MPSFDDRSPSESPSGWSSTFRAVGPYLGLGLQLAFTMIFCAGLGYLADLALGSSPWLTLAGSVLGLVAVFVLLFRTTSSNR